jgi:restriction system protein
MNAITLQPDLPDYQTMMLPLLRIATRGDTTLPQATRRLAAEFALTREQRARTLPGGRYPVFHQRAHWARVRMARAGLIERHRGVFRATERGRALLAARPDRIDMSTLATSRAVTRTAEDVDSALCDALIDRILAIEPGRSGFFEDLVMDLLVAMGYGGGRKGAAIRLARTGDGGVDAVIELDPLGLDLLYAQAKCYRRDNAIDVGMVRDFSGSLDDKKSSRGVLMTTSRFTRAAQDYVRAIRKSIALIDGARLARLMIEHGVGVKQDRASARKNLDEGYFGRGRIRSNEP